MKDKMLYLDSNSFTKGAGDSEDLIIEGYASTVSNDRADHVVLASSWEKGIIEYLRNPVVLAFHQYDNPVGKVLDYKVDAFGLWVKAKISPAADKVFKLIKDGIMSAFSIGFMIKDADYNIDTDVLYIKELELHEISVVSVGMNRDTLFSLSKSFNSNEEFKQFKLNFTKTVKQPDSEDLNNKEELEMSPEDLQKMITTASEKAVSDLLAKQAAEAEALRKAKEEDEKLQARIDSAIKSIQVGESGAERLLADIEKRFADEQNKTKGLIEGLEASLKEKADELKALQKSKMQFTDTDNKDSVAYAEKESVVILSKVLKRPLTDTKFGKQLVEKAGPHVASATWELEVSLNMENEIRRRLVVAPTLRSIPMRTNVMTIPVNPEAGIGTWVTNAQFGTANSSGAEQTHQLGEITLNAYKVSTKEFVQFEEEEDSLILLTPIIRDAMVRRLARAIDRAFLRGAGTSADPVKGLAFYPTTQTTQSIAGGGATIAHLKTLRKNLGAWGLDPAAVVFIVSTDVYYDLLDDGDFSTVDRVGDRATLLTGQIGSVGNSPVLVSAEFPNKANNALGAIAYAPGNFIVGNQRGLRMDSGDLVEEQRRILVGSIRTGMVQTTTNLGHGVTRFHWIT